MRKSIPLITLSIIFVGLGILIKARSPNNVLHFVYELEPICDNTHYLNTGNSWMLNEQKARLKNLELKANRIALPQEKNTKSIFTPLKKGETLYDVLIKSFVPPSEIYKLSQALKPYVDPKSITANDLIKYDLEKAKDKKYLIENFVLKKSNPNRALITYEAKKKPDTNNFIIRVTKPVISKKIKRITLNVRGSLYSTFRQLPFGNDLMQQLITILTWKMRIPSHVRRNDKIELIVERKYSDDRHIGYGNILSLRYSQKNKKLLAFFFSSQDNKIRGYFDQQGHSLEKEFLLRPLYETVATSNQKWRYHPIRKVRIRHNGIDFRGTIGTKFFSIADGKVIAKRYDKNVGNMIRIKHKYGVFTEYFHADSLNENLRVGSRVKKGQNLGTIGETGRLCTGPHLHLGVYKYRNNRKHFISIASLRSILKDAPAIPAEYNDEYFLVVNEQLAFINEEKSITIAKKTTK